MKYKIDLSKFEKLTFSKLIFFCYKLKYNKDQDVQFVRKLNSILQDKILYGQINKIDENNVNPISNIIEGTFFAGSKNASEKIVNAFYLMHDQLYDKGVFIGKDQTIMNYLTYVKKLGSIKKLRTWSLDCSTEYDQWFFYQYFFASSNQYICKNEKLSLIF